jgi:RimJ/RimL family protein N-acetyltransferase
MSALEDWALAPILQTARLSLEPLRIDHAEEMTSVLDDPRLFAFTGGSPCTLDALRARYQRQVSGWSHDRRERWLNWILRERASGQAIGITQATVTVDGDAVIGEVAWIVGSRHQGRGYACEAADAVAAWLREQGARSLFAEIHPDHEASMKVARRIGLKPGDEVLASGEIRWTEERTSTGSSPATSSDPRGGAKLRASSRQRPFSETPV